MKYTGKPVMKSALWAYESAAVAAHEIPPDSGTKAARCAAHSASTDVKAEPDKSLFVERSISIYRAAFRLRVVMKNHLRNLR